MIEDSACCEALAKPTANQLTEGIGTPPSPDDVFPVGLGMRALPRGAFALEEMVPLPKVPAGKGGPPDHSTAKCPFDLQYGYAAMFGPALVVTHGTTLKSLAAQQNRQAGGQAR